MPNQPNTKPATKIGPRHSMGMVAMGRSKNPKATLYRLWKYLSHQGIGLVTVSILTIAGSALALVGPSLIGTAIDQYIIPRDYSGLLSLCLLLCGVYLASAFMTWGQSYIMASVSQKTVWSMRRDLFNKLQDLSLNFFDSKTHGELMSRITNDIENVSSTLSQSITRLLSSIVTVVGALIIMFRLNVPLTLVSLVTIPLIMFVTGVISKHTRTFFLKQQQHLGKLNGFIEETVSGQKVIKVFCREEKSIGQFNEINENLKKVGIKAQILSGIIPPVMHVIDNLAYVLIAWVGGWMAVKDLISIGIVVSFLNYIRQFNRPINELANQFNMIQAAIAGAERVFEVMDEVPEPDKYTQGENLKSIKGKVTFENVYFSYKKGVPVLKNISFTADPGSIIALVGPTGAGKTTIVNILTRFYDIDSGAIELDDKDIRNFNKSSLRRQLGIVLQDAYLFSDTIRENIRYGRLDATDEEVEKAAKLANADGFIRRLPHGYDTVLSTDGSNLSQGQRQLITIARAILADPAILVLDEATSNVDTRTEMIIQEAMKTLMRGRTSFVIAHRLSTIREATMILVINNGEIVERGTHQELLKMKGFYYDLYTSQFKKAV